MNATKKYPDCYLHVRESQSGDEFIMPLRGNASLDLTKQVKKWIAKHFGGEFRLDDKIDRLESQYYARIMTDGRAPDSVVCWTSGGFYVRSNYDC